MAFTKLEKFSFIRVLHSLKEFYDVMNGPLLLVDEEKSQDRPRLEYADGWEERISDFEFMQFIKFKKNAYTNAYKNRKKNDDSFMKWLFIFMDVTGMLYISDTVNRKIKIEPTTKIENEINKLDSTAKFLESWNECQGINYDDIIKFFKSKPVIDILEGYFDNLLNLMTESMNKLNPNKKEYYTQNLDAYLDLFGMKEGKEKDTIRYLTYKQVKFFSLGIANYDMRKTIMEHVGLTENDLKKILVSDVFCLLFVKGKESRILPNTDFIEMIFGIEGTKDYFIQHIIKTTEKSKLTLEDFKHVKQKEYIAQILKNALKTKEKGVNILLYGRPGTGKTELAKVLIDSCGADGYDVQFVEDKNTPWRYQNGKEDVQRRKTTFYTLQNFLKNNDHSVILYDEAEDFFRKEEKDGQSKQKINNYLENNETPVIWTCNSLWDIEQSFLRRFSYVLELDQISSGVLSSLVQKICRENKIKLDERIERLIEQEQPSIGIIKQCLNTYKISNIKDPELLYEALKNSIYAESYNTKKPKDISGKKHAEYNQSLANTNIPLDSITNGIIKSGKNDWSMILYGVSGTGKTAYAEFLGKQLGMKVIKKKVSDLQSMWVGECEKNINKAFEEAKQNNAILLFDEGDCWLKDRRFNRASWETSQSNQFLQNLEEATTPVIITTNLMDSLDQAALRRFVFKVGFKYMTKPQVKEAFKTFYNMDVSDEVANISYLTPGDFVVIGKQLDYLGDRPTSKKVKELLLEEIKNKKDDFKENSMKI